MAKKLPPVPALPNPAQAAGAATSAYGGTSLSSLYQFQRGLMQSAPNYYAPKTPSPKRQLMGGS
jgi:hypothetical protein